MSGKCFVILLSLFTGLFAAFLAFSYVTFKARPSMPQLQLESASASHINYSTSSAPFFKLTMNAQFSLRNRNFGRFAYDNRNVTVLYRNSSIGDGVLGNGDVKGGGTERIYVTFNLKPHNDINLKNLTKDLRSGSLNFTTHTQLSGFIKIFKILKKRRTAQMINTFCLNLTSHAIYDISNAQS